MGSQNDRSHLNWNILVLRGKVIYQITKQEIRGVPLMCHCFSSGHAKFNFPSVDTISSPEASSSG